MASRSLPHRPSCGCPCLNGLSLPASAVSLWSSLSHWSIPAQVPHGLQESEESAALQGPLAAAMAAQQPLQPPQRHGEHTSPQPAVSAHPSLTAQQHQQQQQTEATLPGTHSGSKADGDDVTEAEEEHVEEAPPAVAASSAAPAQAASAAARLPAAAPVDGGGLQGSTGGHACAGGNGSAGADAHGSGGAGGPGSGSSGCGGPASSKLGKGCGSGAQGRLFGCVLLGLSWPPLWMCATWAFMARQMGWGRGTRGALPMIHGTPHHLHLPYILRDLRMHMQASGECAHTLTSHTCMPGCAH